jgi:hypothetical protein
VQAVVVEGSKVSLIALPLIFDQFREAGVEPREGLGTELLDTVRIYNPIPEGAERLYEEALLREYQDYLRKKELA